jgi:hypothetical protein
MLLPHISYFEKPLHQAQADVQHLWFGRRAATRIRSELMASIYEKALKRKDYSGIIDQHKIQKEQEEKMAASGHSKSKLCLRLLHFND